MSTRRGRAPKLLVTRSEDELVFRFGGWRSRMATKPNPDGTTSFLSIDPGVRGFEFNAPATNTNRPYTRLTLRDPQHTYEYDAFDPGARADTTQGELK